MQCITFISSILNKLHHMQKIIYLYQLKYLPDTIQISLNRKWRSYINNSFFEFYQQFCNISWFLIFQKKLTVDKLHQRRWVIDMMMSFISRSFKTLTKDLSTYWWKEPGGTFCQYTGPPILRFLLTLHVTVTCVCGESSELRRHIFFLVRKTFKKLAKKYLSWKIG